MQMREIAGKGASMSLKEPECGGGGVMRGLSHSAMIRDAKTQGKPPEGFFGRSGER